MLLAFRWGEDAAVAFAFPCGLAFDAYSSALFDDGTESHEQFLADLLMGHFAAFEDDADIHLVSIAEEFDGFLGFGAQIVLANGNVELDLFELGSLGILPSLSLGLLLLEAVFAVIEDLADRRIRLGSDAEEIESIGCGDLIGLAGRHFAEVGAIWPDYHDFRVTDILIDGVDAFLRASAIIGVEAWDNGSSYRR